MRAAGRVIDVEMRKRFPAATETKDFDVVLAAAIRGTLDDGIEPRDITATGKDTDTLYSHDLPLKGVDRGRNPSKLEARLSHQHVWVRSRHFAVQSRCPLYPPEADISAARWFVR